MRLVLVREEGGLYEYPSLHSFLTEWRAVPIFGLRVAKRFVLFDRVIKRWRSHVNPWCS